MYCIQMLSLLAYCKASTNFQDTDEVKPQSWLFIGKVTTPGGKIAIEVKQMGQTKAIAKITKGHIYTLKIALGCCSSEQITTMPPHENKQKTLWLLYLNQVGKNWLDN